MSDETRQEREQRLVREFAAYVDDCKSNGIEPLNYMNWHAGKKIEEQWQ